MNVDLENFRPDSVDEIIDVIGEEIGALGQKWWSVNSALVSGYLKSLAEATIQTQISLSQKKITAAQADRIMHMQEVAFTSTLHFTKYMNFALAQKVLDTTFKIIGWAIFNKTGINLFPQLVSTSS